MLTGMGGRPDTVPRWKGSDFDSIFVVTVQRNGQVALES
ncbi:hypothetical protein PMI15_03836 [Polaromonas sp. CF318]|nr:hypothetical protein PMI15_03836 [Polaromonas sp. CF318]